MGTTRRTVLGETHGGEPGTREARADGGDLVEEMVIGLLGGLRQLDLAD
jgi:hypothetical protein